MEIQLTDALLQIFENADITDFEMMPQEEIYTDDVDAIAVAIVKETTSPIAISLVDLHSFDDEYVLSLSNSDKTMNIYADEVNVEWFAFAIRYLLESIDDALKSGRYFKEFFERHKEFKTQDDALQYMSEFMTCNVVDLTTLQEVERDLPKA